MKITATLDTLPEAAARLIEAIGDHRHISLRGPMGAGKTTLIAEICRQLGMVDDASSPTFSIVNEYRDATGDRRVCHFDFYRLEGERDAMEIGVDDYFDSGDLCLMEWTDNIGAALPPDTIYIDIAILDPLTREIGIKY